ncbi:MAG: hypothetical protein KC776_22495, partial [Myxococcales bacterium]|nr:hypothetical protein [Myxococcales bacterium]
GGPAAPAAVEQDLPGVGLAQGIVSEANGLGQPHLFVMKSVLTLAPGESKTLRFVYGYARAGNDPVDDPRFSDPSFHAADAYADALRPRLLSFAAPDAPELGRELAWHAYQMETSVGYRDYWQGHVVPQGSAYLYLHGADGAARDLGLFALPLVYTDPELAKDELRLFMGIQYADERFSYAFQGHGMLDSALIHSAPSDLPLFFVWALGEYLSVTGDLGFLDEHAPYWPREARPDARVESHLVGALRHLFDVVGTGEHGLIRIGTGDWSDGIVQEAKDRNLAVEKGESVPNTQMAVAVLPRIADLLDVRQPALAAEIRERVAGFRAALTKTYNGKFFYRAYFGDGKPAYENTINLESQIWALIGDTFENDVQRDTLVSTIAEKLDDPSPIGATLLPGGQVWPAISAPLTWGYSLSDPERAWRHFTRNTMAAHAQAFPDVWYGIWSGPDGVSAQSGRTWKSQVTPMTDFPVQNANAHAMPLFAAIRIAGVEAISSGVSITPREGTHPLALATRLVSVTIDHGRVSGSYRPSGSSARSLTLTAPPGRAIASLSAGGQNVDVSGTSVTLEVPPGGIDFEMELSP